MNGKSFLGFSIIKNLIINFGAGILIFSLTLPLAWLVNQVYLRFNNQPETAVLMIVILLVGIGLIPILAYLIAARQKFDPAQFSWLILVVVVLFLTAIYFFWVSYYIRYPGDFLIWSESDFVNDILKFRIGYPLYTAQVNNDSFVYPPGAQLVTYFLSSLVGRATSIQTYRAIQVFFTVLAAILATGCVYILLQILEPGNKKRDLRLWSIFLIPLLFLFASNPLTNPFSHNLHNDALAQLLIVVAFLLLLLYVKSRSKFILTIMVLLPALGFLVKQNLAIWAVFYSAFLVIFDHPRSYKRSIIYVIGSFGLLGLVYLVGMLLYGENFQYWLITVLGKHSVSPLRAIHHLLVEVWIYVVLGLIAGGLLLKGESYGKLIGPWIIWLGLITLEIYTSGVAWMINHIGPGSLLAGVWFSAALIQYWPPGQHIQKPFINIRKWFGMIISTSVIVLLFGGLGFVRLPIQPLSDDAYRYLDQINDEFVGENASNILLDVGTWVYVPEQVIMRDRSPSIGERGYSQTGDFSEFLTRIETKYYSKILVRNLHDPDFWYDHYLWSKSSGIREALQTNYTEVGQISRVSGLQNNLFGDISILEPNDN